MRNIIALLIGLTCSFQLYASVLDATQYSVLESVKANNLIISINSDINKVIDKKEPTYKEVLHNFISLGKSIDASNLSEKKKNTLKLDLNTNYKKFKTDPAQFKNFSNENAIYKTIDPLVIFSIFVMTCLVGAILYSFRSKIFGKSFNLEQYLGSYMEGGHVKLPTLVFDLTSQKITYKNIAFENIFVSKTEDEFFEQVSLFLKQSDGIEGDKFQAKVKNEIYMVTRKKVEFNSRKYNIIHLIDFESSIAQNVPKRSNLPELPVAQLNTIDGMLEEYFFQNSFLFQLKGVLVQYKTEIGNQDIPVGSKKVANSLNTIVCNFLKISDQKKLKTMQINCSKKINDLYIEFIFDSPEVVRKFKENSHDTLREIKKDFNLGVKFQPRIFIGKNQASVIMMFPLILNPGNKIALEKNIKVKTTSARA